MPSPRSKRARPSSIEIFQEAAPHPFPRRPPSRLQLASLWGWALLFLSEVPPHADPPFPLALYTLEMENRQSSGLGLTLPMEITKPLSFPTSRSAPVSFSCRSQVHPLGFPCLPSASPPRSLRPTYYVTQAQRDDAKQHCWVLEDYLISAPCCPADPGLGQSENRLPC